MQKIFFTVVVILVLFFIIFFGLRLLSPEDAWICQNDTWIKHGQPSNPAPSKGCGEVDEKKSEEDKKNMTSDSSMYKDLIKLYNPLPEQEIVSPLMVRGEARGNWFFEGDFPVVLTDWDGVIIAEGVAQAQGEWMTEDFVPFQAELVFDKPELYDRGALILKKDNPSGLPENDDAYEITIFFK